jgi:hypothetical protein
MTVGYQAVLSEMSPVEWYVKTATNFENAIEVAETLDVGEMAYADYSQPVAMLRKSAPSTFRVQAEMQPGFKAVLTNTYPPEWMVETATNFENAIDVPEALKVGDMAYADMQTPVGQLRKALAPGSSN